MSSEIIFQIIKIILQIIVAFFEISLAVTAFWITTRREIPRVIGAYRAQSFLLTIAAILIIISKQYENSSGAEKVLIYQPWDIILFVVKVFISQPWGIILFVAALPLSLGVSIRWILARATVHESGFSIHRILTRVTVYQPRQEKGKVANWAKAVWLKSRYEASGKTGLSFVGLLVLAFAIVCFGIDIDVDKRLGIAISLLLHLTGLYNTKERKDVISQMIGILTMDQGMLLAIVKIVSFPFPADLFVFAVYSYTVITLLLLFFIVPSLRRLHKTIDLDKIAVESELRG